MRSIRVVARVAVAGLGLGASVCASATTVMLDTTEYTLTYDSAYSISQWGGGGPPPTLFFNWGIEGSAYAAGGVASVPITIPAFTLQAKAGYQFTDLTFGVSGVYSVFGNATARVDFNGGGSWNAFAGTFTAPAQNIGLWSISSTNPIGTYTSYTFGGGTLTLTANALAGQAAEIIYNGSSTPSFAFQVSPVPEASEWAMMLSGLGLVGVIAQRRRSRGQGA